MLLNELYQFSFLNGRIYDKAIDEVISLFEDIRNKTIDKLIEEAPENIQLIVREIYPKYEKGIYLPMEDEVKKYLEREYKDLELLPYSFENIFKYFAKPFINYGIVLNVDALYEMAFSGSECFSKALSENNTSIDDLISPLFHNFLKIFVKDKEVKEAVWNSVFDSLECGYILLPSYANQHTIIGMLVLFNRAITTLKTSKETFRKWITNNEKF